jgi:hypothetical protein
MIFKSSHYIKIFLMRGHILSNVPSLPTERRPWYIRQRIDPAVNAYRFSQKNMPKNANHCFAQSDYQDTHIHRLRTPGEEIPFTAWPKIKSQSRIYRYGRSIFCLPHRPKISGFFDLCPHWVSVVRAYIHARAHAT